MTEKFNLIVEIEILRKQFNNCKDEPTIDNIFEAIEEKQKEAVKLLKENLCVLNKCSLYGLHKCGDVDLLIDEIFGDKLI